VQDTPKTVPAQPTNGLPLPGNIPQALSPSILAFVLNTANDAVYIYDDQRRILYANDKACEQSGFDRSRLMQMYIADLDPGYPAPGAVQSAANPLHGQRRVFETLHKSAGGALLSVEVSLVSTVIDGVVYNCAFVRSLTQRNAIKQQTDELMFALENASDAIYIYDRAGTIHYANPTACEALGYSRDEILTVSIGDLDPLFSETSNLAFWQEIGAKPLYKQTQHRRKNGSLYPVEILASATHIGQEDSVVVFVRDISERVRAEQAIRDSEEKFRLIADTSPVALLICDAGGGQMHYANSRAGAMFGFDCQNLPASQLRDLLSGVSVDPDVIEQVVRGQMLMNQELMLSNDQLLIWVSFNTSSFTLAGNDVQCIALMDITEARELSNQLSYQATYDDLTGLVNRREFEDRLQEVIELTHKRQSDNVLCYLDLDQFKVINDTCGHMAGDELLRQLAQEIHKCVRRDDTLARLGGDEFAILLENCTLGNAVKVANNVRHKVQDFRFVWQDNVFTVGVSIGITQITREADSISEVMRRADAACYAAKEAGRNRVHVFRFDDQELALRHVEMRWVSRINTALDQDRFELWQQEIAEINRPDSPYSQTAEDHFEVLLRMRDENNELIMPGEFLPAAERYALASKIDRWVIMSIFKWLTQTPGVKNRLGMCSVNLSGQTMSDENFQEEVIAILEDSRVPADKICFEITETSAIANLSSATRFMTRLKEYGCTFALDDFGSGLSSFAYLKTLPVDFVKIDGLFVKDILTDPVDRAMVKAIIDMAHAMGKKAIAEFVENDAILNELIDLDVDYVQGYGVSRPVLLSWK